MLDLTRAYVGTPGSVLCSISLSARTLLVYPSGDTVVLLNARTLQLERILALWEVFPSLHDAGRTISNLVVDSGLNLVAASSGQYLAFWYPSGPKEDTWRVHSSLTLDDEIQSFDCNSGLVAISGKRSISLYSLSLQDDLPTWSRKISRRSPPLRKILFSPSLTHLAAIPNGTNMVQIVSTAHLRATQDIPHMRPLHSLDWRPPKSANGGELVLYTITSDSVLRIFVPVLDSPSHLQLHATLDMDCFVPFSQRKNKEDEPAKSPVFLFNRSLLLDVFGSLPSAPTGDRAGLRRMTEIKEGDWDLFFRVTSDKSFVVRAVANIDSRPPTLIKQFTLMHIPDSPIPLSSNILLTPFTTPSGSTEFTITACCPSSSSPLISFHSNPENFFAALPSGIKQIATQELDDIDGHALTKVIGLTRTPDGRGVAIRRKTGGEVFRTNGKKLQQVATWEQSDDVVVLQGGKGHLTYRASTKRLTLHRLGSTLNDLSVPTLSALFAVPHQRGQETVVAVSTSGEVLSITVEPEGLQITGNYTLPLPELPLFVLPVDPMALTAPTQVLPTELLLCASRAGELSFWRPEEDRWTKTDVVHTSRNDIRLARCSSAKKTVLVCATGHGDEITIWDSKESEFSTGLEYEFVFESEETVLDLDWTATFDSHSILAVGFRHRILLLCQHRLTYFDHEPLWRVTYSIDMAKITPNPINDSIWLKGGSILVGAGHQLFLYTRPNVQKSNSFKFKANAVADLFDFVALQNAPLEDYHPQMLLQCLLWGKVDLVKDIIVRLADSLGKRPTYDEPRWVWQRPKRIEIEDFLKSGHRETQKISRKKGYSGLWNGNGNGNSSDVDESEFTRDKVMKMIGQLEVDSPLDLTANELAHLLILAQTVVEVEEQRRSLDENGLRYLISLRSFYILNRRAAPTAKLDAVTGRTSKELVARERMRYRDFVWAYHSESQEILLDASITSTGKKLLWSDARALGLFIWIKSHDRLRAQAEEIARNQYMAGDARDPTACSLLYFALGKVKLVHGLWKQASWHKEQRVMLKFLSNDFKDARWRTAALKNAYALLGKQRVEYAAAFFLLGGSLQDAVNLCLKQLNDFQLAIAIARIVEQRDDGPVLEGILRNTVVPLAFKEANRWLGSWAFWCLKRRDLAVRILITPLRDLARSVNEKIVDIGKEPHYDDPGLALLFNQLKTKSLQTLKGASEISGREEFKFIMQIIRAFIRMGCHSLALSLASTWSFDQPLLSGLQPSTASAADDLAARVLTRRPSFGMQGGMQGVRRSSSIVIDMEIPSLPPTHPSSPTLGGLKRPNGINGAIVLPPPTDTLGVELGSLLKTARKNTRVPEFDFSHFNSPPQTDPSTPNAATPYITSPMQSPMPMSSGTKSPAIPEFSLDGSPSPQPPETKEHEDPKPKTKGLGTFMKPATQVANVPEFDMSSFF